MIAYLNHLKEDKTNVRVRLREKTTDHDNLFTPPEEPTTKKAKSSNIKVVLVDAKKSEPQNVYIGEEFDPKNRTKSYWSKFDKIH